MADEKTEPKKEANGVADNALVVKLTKQVIANGEEVLELKFREPTAGDIMNCGNPVHFDFSGGYDQEPKMTYNEKAMFNMMSALAAVPPSTIKSMSTRDWEYAALMLSHRFFLPG